MGPPAFAASGRGSALAQSAVAATKPMLAPVSRRKRRDTGFSGFEIWPMKDPATTAQVVRHTLLAATLLRQVARSNQEKIQDKLPVATPLPWLPRDSTCPLWAKSGHWRGYSITSVERARIESGTVKPIAFAVLRLRAKSNFAACSTGRSAGFAPLKILSTKYAARRYIEARFSP